MKPITGITIGGICLVIAAVSFFILFDTTSIYAVEEIITSPCQQIVDEYIELLVLSSSIDVNTSTLVEIDEFEKLYGDSIIEKLELLEQRSTNNNCPDTSSEWYTDEYQEKLEQFYKAALSGT